MSFAFLFVSVLLFVACIKLFGVVPQVQRVIGITRGATATMTSKTLSEEQKEVAVRRAAVQVLGRFCSIALRVALTLAIPVLFVAAGSAISLYTVQEALDTAGNWVFVAVSSVAMIIALAIIR